MIYILMPLALWGLADMYMCYRFIRRPEVDYTAGVAWWWSAKWVFALKTRFLAPLLPFISKDLTEALGIRADDGEIT
jgi:hypothetical protein